MPGTKGNTVKVRIAVAVNEHGDWAASGLSDSAKGHSAGDEQEARDQLAWWEVSTSRDADRVVHYVEADVPVPSSVTVRGVVKKARRARGR